ncbi:MAG: TrkA family potassium uptake protein [Bacteroidales bacterium]|nr:TrkA family potassium uptake protein [Bacteroidales bacterium]
MRFIIIGLGNFGMSLGLQLTAMGHEVIGIDAREQVVEEFKDKFTGTVCLNSVDELAMRTQPLNEVDAVVVAIGEDWAASIQTTALLKKLGVKNIIGRSLSPLHETVLHGLEVSVVVNPEYDAAVAIANRLVSNRVKATYNLTEDTSIYEIEVPNDFLDKTAEDCNLTSKYEMTLVCVKRKVIKKNIIGKDTEVRVGKYMFDSPYHFEKGDIMVCCGTPFGFNKFAEAYLK